MMQHQELNKSACMWWIPPRKLFQSPQFKQIPLLQFINFSGNAALPLKYVCFVSFSGYGGNWKCTREAGFLFDFCLLKCDA